MRKLSSKRKVRKSRSQDEEPAGTSDTSANLEATENGENGGKNDDEASADSENDNSKTVPRKSKKNAASASKKKGGAKSKATVDEPTDTESENDEKDDEKDKDEENGENEEEEYEVKDIIDDKDEKGVTHYLIRWKGYGPDDDTWEPADTLSCPDIIARYQKKKASGARRVGRPSTKDKGATASKQGSKGKGRKRKASDDEEPTDPEKEWEVNKIINVGYDKGVRLFKVRWKGYGPKNDTWEPEEHLNCHDLIDKFLKSVESDKNRDQKELREQPQRTQRFGGDTFRRGSKRNAGRSRTVYYGEDEED